MPLGALVAAHRPATVAVPSTAAFSNGRPHLGEPWQHQHRQQCPHRGAVHLAEREPETQQEPVSVCLPLLGGPPSGVAGLGLRRAHLQPLRHAGGGGGGGRQPTSLLQFREQLVLSLQVDEPPQRNQQKHEDYYANVGDAIRTLREDIPLLFVKDLNCESSCQSASQLASQRE